MPAEVLFVLTLYERRLVIGVFFARIHVGGNRGQTGDLYPAEVVGECLRYPDRQLAVAGGDSMQLANLSGRVVHVPSVFVLVRIAAETKKK